MAPVFVCAFRDLEAGYLLEALLRHGLGQDDVSAGVVVDVEQSLGGDDLALAHVFDRRAEDGLAGLQVDAGELGRVVGGLVELVVQDDEPVVLGGHVEVLPEDLDRTGGIVQLQHQAALVVAVAHQYPAVEVDERVGDDSPAADVPSAVQLILDVDAPDDRAAVGVYAEEEIGGRAQQLTDALVGDQRRRDVGRGVVQRRRLPEQRAVLHGKRDHGRFVAAHGAVDGAVVYGRRFGGSPVAGFAAVVLLGIDLPEDLAARRLDLHDLAGAADGEKRAMIVYTDTCSTDDMYAREMRMRIATTYSIHPDYISFIATYYAARLFLAVLCKIVRPYSCSM